MALTTIFEEQTVEGFVGDTETGIAHAMIDTTSALVVGESYKVLWDGTEVTLVAIDTDGFPCLNNEVGGFAVMYLSPEIMAEVMGTESGAFQFISMDTEATSHTVGIYQVTSDDDTGGEEEGGDGGTEEEQEGIILKDRNGNNVAYYGIETVSFDTTTEGKQQKYTKGVKAEKTVELSLADGDQTVEPDEGTLLSKVTIEKPETLLPENVRNGVEVAGVTGEFIGDTEEATVELALADGNQEVVPSADGKVISKVKIVKPETLLPENIAEGIDIAGIIGTLAAGSGGGGGLAPLIFICHTFTAQRFASTYRSFSISHSVPSEANILLSNYLSRESSNTSVSTTGSSVSMTNSGSTIQPNRSGPTVTETTSGKQVSHSFTKTASSTYGLGLYALLTLYTMPGIYLQVNADGTQSVVADETATVFPNGGVFTNFSAGFKKVDLSNSNITDIGYGTFYYTAIDEIVFPASIASISYQSLYTNGATVLDFSLATAVPTLISSSAIYATDGLQIKVPTVLYDEWIAATNWSSHANYIVAV